MLVSACPALASRFVMISARVSASRILAKRRCAGLLTERWGAANKASALSNRLFCFALSGFKC